MGMESLIKLQQLDLSEMHLEKKLKKIPDEIEKLQKKKQEILSKSDSLKEQLKKKMLEQKDLEMDVQTFKEKIKKVERDLINAKTNHEYKELLKVKAQYEKEIIDTEDKILKLMEEIEELEEEKEKLEQLLQNEVKEIDEKIKEKERELQETKENIKKIDQEKEEFKKNVDNNLLRRYEMIKKRVKNGIVIAAVDDNICSGCFMMIPPKLLNDLIKNKDKDKLYQCPNCGRFLYYKE